MHWLAVLNNGEIWDERQKPHGWTPDDHISPWRGLMSKCNEEGLYIVTLQNWLGEGYSYYAPPDKEGYWHMRASHGMQGAQQLDYSAIGWVEEGVLHAQWSNGKAVWSETRPVKEDQVIWKSGR